MEVNNTAPVGRHCIVVDSSTMVAELAAIEWIEPGQRAEQQRFARSRRPLDPDSLPRGELDIGDLEKNLTGCSIRSQ